MLDPGSFVEKLKKGLLNCSSFNWYFLKYGQANKHLRDALRRERDDFILVRRICR